MGQYTFGNSLRDIASIILSTLPFYEKKLSDEFTMLPLLRHFYASALKYSCITAIDIDTHMPCLTPVRAAFEDGEVKSVMLPHLLSVDDKLKAYEVSTGVTNLIQAFVFFFWSF
eukprot:TRINITY_DN16261_c0_g1_i1.p1 TRINITY_DN16261_c0_g1~~TRINITY_DN16261_c0_g1_i1.p1  ORF type:complete len:123 (+),score=31.99 TRINITY_DN16261_c0_g1_i1:29-370(+)